MKKRIVYIGIALLAACAAEQEKPKNLLPASKMKVVLWEMSVADVMASEKYILQRDSQQMMVTGLYQKIFKLHKIDKKTFYNSFAWYEAHPVEMQTLYDSISAYGTRQKAKVFQKSLNIRPAEE